jgi:tetratricopeptide (TPR) repeat protein
LIDANTGRHVWAERYDRDIQDIFAVQDELTRSIVSTLHGRLEAAGIEHAKLKKTNDITAYDFLLKGIELHQRFTRSDNELARKYFSLAIERDPEFAEAHAWLALTYVAQLDADALTSRVTWLDKAVASAIRAVALDSNDSTCQEILGLVFLEKREFDRALGHTLKAVQLNPNDADGLAHLGLVHNYMGNLQAGEAALRTAVELDPFHPIWHDAFLAHCFYLGRRYQEAARQISSLTSGTIWAHAVAAASFAMLGTDARQHVRAIQAMMPNFSSSKYVAEIEPFKNKEDAEHFLAGLVKAGLRP